MASSRKRRSDDLAARVRSELGRHVPRGARLTLALSGGVDSIALLDLLAGLAPRHPFALDCLHVNHGLSPNAPAWARFARAAAGRYGLRCAVRKVDLTPYRALGLEGAARAARYAAFAALRSDFVALAQHQDDQAETVLLQLVRGAGLAGLAGMPSVRAQAAGSRVGPAVFRPLLGVGRAEIDAFARARGLAWKDDESNTDLRRARNLVRHRILPLLAEINPRAAANLARSAALAAEANDVLMAVAAEDAGDGALAVAGLAGLPQARAANALRGLLARAGVAAPGRARLDEALRQLVGARADAAVRIPVGDAEIRRYRGQVWVVRRMPPVPRAFAVRWPGRPVWRIPELGGVLRIRRVQGRGLSATAAASGPIEVRVRRGGERFRPDERRPRRTLKMLLQESEIPPWERSQLPLLHCNGALAWVPGIGVAAALRARQGEPGLELSWERSRGDCWKSDSPERNQ